MVGVITGHSGWWIFAFWNLLWLLLLAKIVMGLMNAKLTASGRLDKTNTAMVELTAFLQPVFSKAIEDARVRVA